MPNDSVDIVTRPPWRSVRAAMRLLRAVADARTIAQAERRFDQLEFRAQKSSAFAEATYVAAQVLRDMDVLSQSEATYVFRGLFDLRSEEYSTNDAYHQAHLNAYVKETTERPSAADSDERVDRLTDELIARTQVLEARFHHARGEPGLAKLLLRNVDTARKLYVDGEWSLIAGKFGTDDEEDDEPDPAVVAAICERIAALATADTTRETVDKHGALAAALDEADVASAMAAVRELRQIGLVSFSESVPLPLDILDSLVSLEVDGDHECVRLQARIDELSGDQPEEWERRWNTGKTGRVLRALERRLQARGRPLLAMCLRRFGEHEVATLVIEEPKEFERLAGDFSLGAWGGPSVPDGADGHGSEPG